MERVGKGAAIARGVFLVAFLGFIFSLVLAKGLTAIGIPLPEAMAQNEVNSVLEGRNYQKFPTPTLSSFAEGDFQGHFEQWVSDLTPNRDEVILANAAFQRKAVEASAALFGYRVAPTFFGSEYFYDPHYDALLPLPAKTDSNFAQALPDAADAINGFAERHPEKSIVFANFDRLEFSDLNPLYDLVEDAVDRSYVKNNFLDQLDEAVTVVSAAPDDADSYFSDVFRTDHHWNTPAAYAAYEKCLSALKPGESPVAVEEEIVWSGVPFYGARARSALFQTTQPDILVDYIYDESNLLVDYKGEGDSEKLRHRELYGSGEYDHRLFANHYADYFHADPELFTIENRSLPDGDTLLIVGDSYTSAMERFLAEHYGKVVVVDPRHLSCSLDEVMSEYDPDDVLFLMAGYTYTNSDALEVVGG